MRRSGFTLLELLIAISVLVVIVAIVYACLMTTTDSVEHMRVSAEEMRLRQALARNLVANFSAAYLGPSGGNQQGMGQLWGVDDEVAGDPCDTVRFASTAPLLGAASLPGDVKYVEYVVADSEEVDTRRRYEDIPEAERLGRKLNITEAAGFGSSAPGTGEFQEAGSSTETGTQAKRASRHRLARDTQSDESESMEQESPRLEVPVRSLNFSYYDGREWLDEWDSAAMGRLPWCVHVKINFAKTDRQLAEDKEAGVRVEEDPDFDMVIPIAAGIGLTRGTSPEEALEDQDEHERGREQETQTPQTAPRSSTRRTVSRP